eukprot:m51a1_g9462 hypothetical protein (187) ;mRNA; f:527005-527720
MSSRISTPPASRALGSKQGPKPGGEGRKEGEGERAGEENSYVREVFSLYEDANGRLPTTELTTVIRALGRNPDEQRLREICKENEAIGCGAIDFNKFHAIWKKEEEIRNSLKIFNRDDKGKVYIRDMSNILKVVGEGLAPDEVDRLEHDLLAFAQLPVYGAGTAAQVRDPWLPFSELCEFLGQIYV